MDEEMLAQKCQETVALAGLFFFSREQGQRRLIAKVPMGQKAKRLRFVCAFTLGSWTGHF